MLRKYSVDAFMEACGARDSLMLDVQRGGDEESRRVALNQPFAVIGRAANADLPLSDGQLARRHAYLQMIAGQVCCVNLGDPAGVRWGQKASPSGWLPVRQAVHLGEHRIRLLRAAAPDLPPDLGKINPLGAGSAAELGLPSLILGFLRDDAVRMRWYMDRLLVLVGSAPDCRVRIAATDGSRFHCSLVSTPQGVWLVDLLGRGGTFLNGVQVRQALLEDGDILRIGQLAVRVQYAGGSPPARPPAEQQTAMVPFGAPGALLPQEVLPAAPFEGLGQALLGLQDPQNQALGSVVLPLVNQFNLMQQQMMDQFQQALVQMFQMFSGLHKDQMGYLREEMERQQQITQELRALQAELTKLRAAAPGQGQRQAAAGQAGANGVGVPVPPPRTAPAGDPGAAASARAEKPTPPPAEACAAPGQAGGAPAAAGQARVAGGASPPGLNGEDVHAWLCQRMADLQQERQSRWRRLLNFLAGKPSEGHVPK
jgi:predicted component of type VI protein secretion system